MQLKMEQIESNSANNNQPYPPLRRPRTREDFYLFCKIILEYENYEMLEDDDIREPMDVSSPELNSAGSTKSESTTSSVPEFKSHSHSEGSEDSDDVDTESYYLVTCYCGKPYAKRPMIECSKCLTWLHLTCAKVKRNHIPEIFYCYKCKLIMSGENHPSNGIATTLHSTNHVTNNTSGTVANHNNNTAMTKTFKTKSSQKRESLDSYQMTTDKNLNHKYEDRSIKRSSL